MGRNRRAGMGYALVLLVLGLLVGCSGAGEDAATSAPDRATAVDEGSSGAAGTPEELGGRSADGEAQASASPGPGSEGDVSHLDPLPVMAGRRVIRSAQLVLEVEDPRSAADQVERIADRAGGFVAETDLERDRDGAVTGSIILRVPERVLDETIDELDALAEAVPVRRLEETDVTSETTDLEARRRNLLAYEGELRQLLADVRETSGHADELLSVFERIREVRAEIDRIDARLAMLADQVALSTIDVLLRPGGTGVLMADGRWQPGETILQALQATGRALARIGDAAIWVALTGVPIAAVAGSPLIVGLLLWRRRRPLDRLGSTPAPPSSP